MKKMRLLEEQGYLKKDVVNNQLESIRLNDLELLKKNGGPFTSPEDVDVFKRNIIGSEEKTRRLYIEVRYAKNSSLILKHTASVFPLKRNGKNLQTEEYAKNLRDYLDDVKKTTPLTVHDLNHALEIIIGQPTGSNESHPGSNEIDNAAKESSDINVGEHVVVFGRINAAIIFGILGSLTKLRKMVIRYHIPSETKRGCKWSLPEKEEIQETIHEQIIASNIDVSYHCTEDIVCEISIKDVEHILEKINDVVACY
jgi:hypothetical protein